MVKRVGFLTSGGDCQALNATMRGIAKTLYNRLGKDVEIYGFLDGYKGLMYKTYCVLKPSDFSGLLTIGGTILGSSRQPFKMMTVIGQDGFNKVAAMKQTYAELKLDCLVILGGNGTQKTANLLSKEGLNVVSLPKTIDNDIYGTDMTFGFQSAVDIAAQAIDCIHTTAASHGRTFIIELMGHKVGWLTLHAGIASGADIILLPEIPYNIDKVLEAITRRHQSGKRFSILAAAEGAISKEEAKLTKKELAKKRAASPFPSVSYELGKKIEDELGQEVRIVVPGHTQRGGSPDPYDRVVSSRLGAAAGRLIIEEKYGYMVGFKGDQIIPIPLAEVAGKLKMVDPQSEIILQAKDLGISFGD